MIPAFLNRWLPKDEKIRAGIFSAVAFVAGMMASPLFGFLITGTLGSLQERATFPMLERRIEVAREAARKIPCDGRIIAYAPVIAQAMDWDLRIAHEKESNRHIYSDYFSPDGWNAVSPIPIPCDGR